MKSFSHGRLKPLRRSNIDGKPRKLRGCDAGPRVEERTKERWRRAVHEGGIRAVVAANLFARQQCRLGAWMVALTDRRIAERAIGKMVGMADDALPVIEAFAG